MRHNAILIGSWSMRIRILSSIGEDHVLVPLKMTRILGPINGGVRRGGHFFRHKKASVIKLFLNATSLRRIILTATSSQPRTAYSRKTARRVGLISTARSLPISPAIFIMRLLLSTRSIALITVIYSMRVIVVFTISFILLV